jgi:hypothetical protein
MIRARHLVQQVAAYWDGIWADRIGKTCRRSVRRMESVWCGDPVHSSSCKYVDLNIKITAHSFSAFFFVSFIYVARHD